MDGTAPRTTPARVLYAWGTVLLLAGNVLPWLRATGDYAAWEFSLVWALTGRPDHISFPPAVGAVVLLCGLACAWFFLFRPSFGGPLPAAAAGLTIGVCGLTLFRALTWAQEPLLPGIGLLACLAGGILAGAGTLLEGDD
jgi:hypothetical protein